MAHTAPATITTSPSADMNTGTAAPCNVVAIVAAALAVAEELGTTGAVGLLPLVTAALLPDDAGGGSDDRGGDGILLGS
jgi:hypothetical protein